MNRIPLSHPFLLVMISALASANSGLAQLPRQNQNLQNSVQNLKLADAASADTPRKKPASEAVDWTSKRIVCDFSAKPWPKVLEWFADEARMPLILESKAPQHGLTFANPKDEKGNLVKYSLIEIYDILNEILQAELKLTLLRGETTMRLVSLDYMNDPGFRVPFLSLEDLPKRGKTEIVKVLINLRIGADAEDFGKKAKRLLGDFGRVVVIEESNQVLVHATAGSVRLVIEILADGLPTKSEAVAPPASPPPPPAACCETLPRCRAILRGRLLRR